MNTKFLWVSIVMVIITSSLFYFFFNFKKAPEIKKAKVHVTTVELDLADEDTVAAQFTTKSGKFDLTKNHELIERDSSETLAFELNAFKVLSDSLIDQANNK